MCVRVYVISLATTCNKNHQLIQSGDFFYYSSSLSANKWSHGRRRKHRAVAEISHVSGLVVVKACAIVERDGGPPFLEDRPPFLEQQSHWATNTIRQMLLL